MQSDTAGDESRRQRRRLKFDLISAAVSDTVGIPRKPSVQRSGLESDYADNHTLAASCRGLLREIGKTQKPWAPHEICGHYPVWSFDPLDGSVAAPQYRGIDDVYIRSTCYGLPCFRWHLRIGFGD